MSPSACNEAKDKHMVPQNSSKSNRNNMPTHEAERWNTEKTQSFHKWLEYLGNSGGSSSFTVS